MNSRIHSSIKRNEYLAIPERLRKAAHSKRSSLLFRHATQEQTNLGGVNVGSRCPTLYKCCTTRPRGVLTDEQRNRVATDLQECPAPAEISMTAAGTHRRLMRWSRQTPVPPDDEMTGESSISSGRDLVERRAAARSDGVRNTGCRAALVTKPA